MVAIRFRAMLLIKGDHKGIPNPSAFAGSRVKKSILSQIQFLRLNQVRLPQEKKSLEIQSGGIKSWV